MMKKYMTSRGSVITAKTLDDAARMAADFGMGEIIDSRPAPKKTRQSRMTLRRAYGLLDMAYEYPRCGEGWPETAEEIRAHELLETHDPEYLADKEGTL